MASFSYTPHTRDFLMTWSKQFTGKAILKDEAERDAGRASVESANGARGVKQYQEALKAVDSIIDSGAIGSETQELQVSLSGHAYPTPQAGDSISIYIAGR